MPYRHSAMSVWSVVKEGGGGHQDWCPVSVVLCVGGSSSGVGRVGHVVAPIYVDGASHCSSTIMAVISPTKVFLPLLHWKSLCRNQQLCLLVWYLLQSGEVAAASSVWWCRRAAVGRPIGRVYITGE